MREESVRRVSLPGVLALLVLLGLAFYWAPLANARRLGFAPQFGVQSAEFAELVEVLEGLRARAGRGELELVRRHLQAGYRAALERRLAGLGRVLDAATLPEIPDLIPLPLRPEAHFELGLSEGNEVLLLFAEPRAGGLRRGPARLLLTALPLHWDGHRFRIGNPTVREAHSLRRRDVGAALVEAWRAGQR